MAAGSILNFDRTRFANLADWLAVAAAASLPWSTSATGILVTLWLLALIPTLTWAEARRELATPAGGLPVLLVLLGALGMLWADVTLLDRWKGIDSFFKLLVIPLLMIQFRRSDGGMHAFIAFLIACVLLLIASGVVYRWPGLPKSSIDTGVIVKNYIIQSAEFTMCLFALFYICFDALKSRRLLWAAVCLVLAAAFLADMLFIAIGRTSLLVIPILAVLLGMRQFGWKGVAGAVSAMLVLAAVVWMSSGYLRDRVNSAMHEITIYEATNVRTSAGERLEFWKKSAGFVAQAPVIGHGTGTITEMFRRAAVGKSGVGMEVASNPHNQTFAVAIQLGLVGAALLWAMWLSHLLLFRGEGLLAWIGLMIVVQNVVGSLLNSQLFDFTEGWIYVFGVGITAGMLRRQAPPDPAEQARATAAATRAA